MYVPQPGELVHGIGPGGMDKPREHDGLATTHVHHGTGLPGQEGRIAVEARLGPDLFQQKEAHV